MNFANGVRGFFVGTGESVLRPLVLGFVATVFGVGIIYGAYKAIRWGISAINNKLQERAEAKRLAAENTPAAEVVEKPESRVLAALKSTWENTKARLSSVATSITDFFKRAAEAVSNFVARNKPSTTLSEIAARVSVTEPSSDVPALDETAPAVEPAPQQQPVAVYEFGAQEVAIEQQERAAFVATDPQPTQEAILPETTQKQKTTMFRAMPKLGVSLSKMFSFNRNSANSDSEAAPRTKRTKSKPSQQ